MQRKHRIGITIALIAKLSGAAFLFLFSLVLAQVLGPSYLGIFYLALTIITIGATIARLGLDNAVLKFSSIAYGNNNVRKIDAIYRSSIGLVLITGTVITLVIWIISPYLELGGDKSADFRSILAIMLLALLPSALLLLKGEFFKALGMPGFAILVQAGIFPALLFFGSLLLLLYDSASVQHVAYSPYLYTWLMGKLLHLKFFSVSDLGFLRCTNWTRTSDKYLPTIDNVSSVEQLSAIIK